MHVFAGQPLCRIVGCGTNSWRLIDKQLSIDGAEVGPRAVLVGTDARARSKSDPTSALTDEAAPRRPRPPRGLIPQLRLESVGVDDPLLGRQVTILLRITLAGTGTGSTLHSEFR